MQTGEFTTGTYMYNPFLCHIRTADISQIIVLPWSSGYISLPRSIIGSSQRCVWSRGYKIFFMFNSAEHKILTAYNYQNTPNILKMKVYNTNACNLSC